MEQSPIRIAVEKRQPINRPKYKGYAMTWKRLFIGTACIAVVLAYLLMMALKGNATLQRQVFTNHLTEAR